MTTSRTELRAQLAEEAQHRCGYCKTHENVSGIPQTFEHIIPLAKGGRDEETNLWLSCRLCNEAKGTLIEHVDPESGSMAPLFNPRTQNWQEHFSWREDGTSLVGLTPVGRATVNALNLNSEFRVRSRTLWVEAGWHPPK